jgi:hypothetical protein
MFARIKLPAFFLIAMMFPMALTAATEKQVNYSRMTHGGKVVVGKAMDIGREHKGIKVEAITFSGNEAIVIVWNRTPNGVTGHVGIALYDKKNRLIAAQSDSTSVMRKMTKIRSGKQANFKVKFKKFLPNFKGVAKYRLVFTTTSTTS